MNNENKRHYIADENLGGIEREYTETDREAAEGGYIVGNSGTIYQVNNIGSSGTVFGEISVIAHKDQYTTLSPTDIIRHNGERYRLVTDRKAEVGDKIIVTATNSRNMRDVKIGGVYVIISRDLDGSPVVNDEPTPDNSPESQPDLSGKEQPDLLDLVIRLSRTVADLEKRAESSEQELSGMSEVFEKHRDWTSHRIGNVRETANNADYKAGQALTTAGLQAEKPGCCRCC